MMRRKRDKTISIIIPVYNEEHTISEVIKGVLKSDTLEYKKEIIIINDGSDDNTRKIISRYSTGKNIKVIHNSHNYGKGYSVRKGIKISSGDIVLIQDADLEYSPTNYLALIEPINNEYADVVYGSRFISSGPYRVLFYYHYLANKLITTFSNMFTNLNMTDIETGYKVFRGDIIRSIVPRLVSSGFGFEPEITARISKIPHIRIYEVGITYFGRTYQEGKKIGWKDGLLAIIQIIRFNIFN